MGKKADTYAEWRLRENLSQYHFYTMMYRRLLMSYFNWTFPTDVKVSTDFLERALYENGFVIFYNDTGVWRVAKADAVGLNDYDEPTGYTVLSHFKGMKSFIKASECVRIQNDKLCYPSFEAVNFFAKKLERIEKTIDTNMEHLKKPYIISCPPGQVGTMRTVMQKKSDGEYEIFVNDDFSSMNKVEILDFRVKNEVPDLYEIKRNIINESLTYFGINNIDFEKKERMVANEVDGNNERIKLSQNILYEPRKRACVEIKSKFDLDVDVKIAFDSLKTNVEMLKGVDGNG